MTKKPDREEAEESSNYPPRMYWREVWRNRVRARFYSLPRLIPPVLVSIAQFVWKHNANTPFAEMWIAIGIVVAVYFALFLLETLWKFVVSTPPTIYGEQIEVIQQLHGQLSVFENKPEVSATDQRRRDQVRETWKGLTPDEKAVVQFIHDRGDTDAMSFNESGLKWRCFA